MSIKSTTVATLAAILVLAACTNNEPTKPPTTHAALCPSGVSPTAVSLPLGGVQVLGDTAELDCIGLSASDGAAANFLLVAANANPLPDSMVQYAMVDSTGGSVLANRRFPLNRLMSLAASSIAEGRFRAMERRVLHLDDPASFRRAAAARASLVPNHVSATVLPKVGDTLSFNVPDPNANNACTSFTKVRAVVETIGTHGILIQDVNAPAGGFTASDFAAISNEFDGIIYPTDTVHFGGPSDIDNNGHVYLLYTPVVNSGTKRGSQGVLDGYFFGGDLFPTSQCQESNLAEIFYLIVPDPKGQFSDPRSTADVRQDTRGTIAHEFQHMINEGVRIAENAPDEATWLNEGLSHFAEEIVGRAERGYSDTQKLAISDVADSSDNFADFNAFFGQNLVRFREWLVNPGALGATSSHADTSLAVRGAAWALLRWTADHYAGGNVAAFTRALVAGPDTSVANLTARAGVPFDSLMAGWTVANFTDDAGIANLDPKYTFESWNIRSVEAAVNQGVFPLAPTSLTAGQSASATTDAAAASYFELPVNAAAKAIFGQVTTTGTPASYTGARLYIVRIQ